MKLQNVLTQSLLCAALTGLPLFSSFSHAAQTAKKPQVAQPTKASEGGASGGGGNAITEEFLTAEEIEFMLGKKQVRIVAESLLYTFESTTSIHKVAGLSAHLTSLSFAALALKNYGLENAVNALYSSTFKFGANIKNCIDPKTKIAVDAYTDVTKGTICFDIKRLEARNLSKKHADSVLASLIIHEVSHIFGANEEEAQALQKFVSDIGLKRETLNRTKMNSTLKLSEFIFNIETALRQMHPNINASTLRICQTLAVQSALMSDIELLLVYNTSNTGAMLMPYKRLRKVQDLANVSNMTVQGFCAEGSDRNDLNYYFGSSKMRTEAGATVLNSGFENREGLQKNLDEVLKLASQILQEVRESSPTADCTFVNKRSSSCSAYDL